MKVFRGIAGAPGFAFGKLIHFEKTYEERSGIGIDEAADAALERVRALYDKTAAELGEEHAKIFSAYEMLLGDPVLLGQIRAMIEGGAAAADAVRTVTGEMADKLASKNNEYMRQRAEDIRYIGGLLIDALHGADTEFAFPSDGEKYIVAAHELTPVDTMMLDRSRLAGFICETGGATSHVIILAKSLGIPAVVGADGLCGASDGESAFIDGYAGELTVSPSEEKSAELERKLAEERNLHGRLEELKGKEARTADGERIAVCINIGKPSDMDGAEHEMIDGVGLFRSEFLYSSAKKKPTPDEQIRAYRTVIEKAQPNTVTVRTLDIGGDKQLDYLEMKHEDNPFLGNRGIRLCLSNPKLFEEQLRAILIAGAGCEVKIMLPMVCSIGEIKRASELIDGVKAELEAEGTEFCRSAKLGIMIETPASAIMAETFAKHCDFFSIGTNDLVQYIMAADRGNAAVEELYNPYHPSVMRMLKNVIKAGHDAGIEVSVCGDMAANTVFTKVLLGMGLKKFSVPLPMVGRLKDRIGKITLADAEKLAEAVLTAEDENEIKNILAKE